MTMSASDAAEWPDDQHSLLSGLHAWVYLAREFDYAYRRVKAPQT